MFFLPAHFKFPMLLNMSIILKYDNGNQILLKRDLGNQEVYHNYFTEEQLREARLRADREYEESRQRFKQKRIELQINDHQNWIQQQMLRIEETEFELIRPSNKPKEKEILFKKQNGLCALCKLPIKKGGGTIDHILPKGKGGSSHISNKQLAHYYCNNAKGDSTELLSPTRYQDLALQLKEKVYAKRKKRGKGQLEKSYLSSIL